MPMSRDTMLDRTVLPGEVRFARAPAQLSTLLGSCVAITLWHPGRKMGGLCHFLLPERPPTQSRIGLGLDGRYGDEALQLLLQAAERAGCTPAECEFKLFGGGCMLACDGCTTGLGQRVHERNVEQALTLMRQHGLKVSAHHLGGDGHRQLRLDLATGDVWMRFSPLDEGGERGA